MSPSKRKPASDAPFGGVDVPMEWFGTLCWLVAGYSDYLDRKSLRVSCKAAFVGFRSNATRIVIRSDQSGQRHAPRFYDNRPFSRVTHIAFRACATRRYGPPFPEWSRDVFPEASTMSVRVSPMCRMHSDEIRGIWGYPLYITEFEGTCEDLEELAKGFEENDEHDPGESSPASAYHPTERWSRLVCVSITRCTDGYRRDDARPVFGARAKKVICHHALDQVRIWDPFAHIDDIMLHPPKRILVDRAALAPVVNHPKFDEVGSVSAVYIYDSKWEARNMTDQQPAHYDGRKLLPKLDPMSLVRNPDIAPLDFQPNDPPVILVAALIGHTRKGITKANPRPLDDLAKMAAPVALSVKGFLTRALRETCASSRGLCVVVRVLHAIETYGGHTGKDAEQLTAVARSVFTSAARENVWDADYYVHAEIEQGIDKLFHIWREFFMCARSHVMSSTSTYGGIWLPKLVEYHRLVTSVEPFLRGDDCVYRGCDDHTRTQYFHCVPSSLWYLYRSVYPSYCTDEAAKQELTTQRMLIKDVREELALRKTIAVGLELKIIQLYEERLKNAMECTGLLGEVLCGDDKIVLR